MNKQPSHYKRGNGAAFLNYQDQMALAYNLNRAKGGLNGTTFENLDYEEVRNKFSNKAGLSKMKERDMETENQKFYERLMNIIQHEKT